MKPADIDQSEAFRCLGELLSLAVDLCSFGLDNFSNQEHVLAEISLRSKALSRDFTSTSFQASAAAEKITELRAESKEQLEAISQYSTSAFESLREDISHTAENTLRVLEIIRSINKETHLLSLNARVEAARSGDSGAGFGVIAQEIGNLSNRTITSVADASKVLDLTDKLEHLTSATAKISDMMANYSAQIDGIFDDVSKTIDHVCDRLSEVDDYQAVLNEMIETSSSSSSLVREKIERASAQVQDAADVCAPGFSATRIESVSALCEKAAVNVDLDYDRLEAIKERGVVRLAIDPNLIGLSFRQKPDAPLIGLDVEYAQSFAEWLGVRCEFVEHAWDRLTELLHIGIRPGEEPVDAVWSGLPPNSGYRNVAYSETYTWMNFALCRRTGDARIGGLQNLDGKTLGIINDPAAFQILEDTGIRWSENKEKPGGSIHLAGLIPFNDQSRIHDALVEGVVDGFAVDQPVFYWASQSSESKWYNQIEILPGNISQSPFYYAVAVAARKSSLSLLSSINRFFAAFKTTPKRRKLEERWQGEVVEHSIGYRDEPGDLLGEQELRALVQAV